MSSIRLPADPVAQDAGGEEQTGEDQRVRVDRPLQVGLARAEAVHRVGDGAQRDVEHGVVEHHHEQTRPRARRGWPSVGGKSGRRAWMRSPSVRSRSPPACTAATAASPNGYGRDEPRAKPSGGNDTRPFPWRGARTAEDRCVRCRAVRRSRRPRSGCRGRAASTRACGLISWAAKTPVTGASSGSRPSSSR